MHKKYNMYKPKQMLGTSLGIILLKIEPISGLHQLVSIKFNQIIKSLFKDSFNNERTIPHGFKFPYPQGILVLVIDWDVVIFRENLRFYNLIILNLDSFLMSLINCGCISTLLIKTFR